jgi:hypothetical protein
MLDVADGVAPPTARESFIGAYCPQPCGNSKLREQPMKLWFPLVVLIAAAPSIANAAEVGQSYGIGTHSCGEFA